MPVSTAGGAFRDYASIARNVIPSGQYGGVPVPPQATQQAQMYDALTPLFNHVTPGALLADFKSESVANAVCAKTSSEVVPQPGVKIVRDSFNVPHICGSTRDDVTWGAGWVLAEDRGLLLSQARYPSLLAAVDAPGIDALGLISSLS